MATDKQLKVNIPPGYKIDEVHSTFTNIIFIPIEKSWEDEVKAICEKKGEYYFINDDTKLNLIGLRVGFCGNARPSKYLIHDKKLAEYLAEKLTLIQEMEVFAWLRNGNCKPNWYDIQKRKYGLVAQHKNDENCLIVDFLQTTNNFLFGICVNSKEIANEMLKIFGDRIKAVLYNNINNK